MSLSMANLRTMVDPERYPPAAISNEEWQRLIANMPRLPSTAELMRACIEDQRRAERRLNCAIVLAVETVIVGCLVVAWVIS